MLSCISLALFIFVVVKYLHFEAMESKKDEDSSGAAGGDGVFDIQSHIVFYIIFIFGVNFLYSIYECQIY